jgi:hypothetical protein
MNVFERPSVGKPRAAAEEEGAIGGGRVALDLQGAEDADVIAARDQKERDAFIHRAAIDGIVLIVIAVLDTNTDLVRILQSRTGRINTRPRSNRPQVGASIASAERESLRRWIGRTKQYREDRLAGLLVGGVGNRQVPVDQPLVQIFLFEVGEQMRRPAPAGRSFGFVGQPAWRQHVVRVVILMQGQAKLLEMVFALRRAGGFAGHLHCWQEKRDQHADDRNHDEELDKG